MVTQYGFMFGDFVRLRNLGPNWSIKMARARIGERVHTLKTSFNTAFRGILEDQVKTAFNPKSDKLSSIWVVNMGNNPELC